MLAAVFTALSAYQDHSSIPLTVLIAANTVVAGILAWLKGQGIPKRFRRARNQFASIVKDIGMIERLSAEYSHLLVNTAGGEDAPDPRKEMHRLLDRFDVARTDQQNNYPDVYVLVQSPVNAQAQADEFRKTLNTMTSDFQTAFTKREQDLIERIRVLEMASKPVQTTGHSSV